ncbi:heavy metal translocating P-type ATPase [Paenibacillus pasadenensis]|jgi:Cd2+/Zn2+-exporting ATPase|uniref:Cd(2+)-exporting ATPase n=1 Tax=Paenibacillus pasadenensis TaxID=217090 RepID=A0A2N5NBB2_9BACL|nr:MULTISPECIES: heavy metal translocating P-type ATPase [Paenibacillaceae]MED1725017.1 heavy metal translocating P-type ATPase [Brevibacillus parabrevis]PLT47613.1 Lead, cadmium, zinc and mercury transporting ATPase [Paenibacillus pasadenensis]
MSDVASKKSVYRVQGFTCTNCAAKFEQNVKALPEVEDAQVNFGASKISVYGEASVQELEKAGAFEGLKVYPEKEQRSIEKEPFWKRRSTITTALSAIFLISGWFVGEEHPASFMLFALAILIGGYELFIKGIRSLVRFNFNMNTLMTIAIIGAAAIGQWMEGATVVFLFAISEALESFSMEKARHSIRSLMNVAPKEATIRRGGQELQINVDDIAIGDIMIVKPGQKIAMDGKVIKGRSAVNQAAITGESVPVEKTEGDDVFAGTLNEEGLLEVEITKRVEDTTIAKIIHLVEEAQAEKAPSQAFVDRFAQYYTPAILVLALGIAVVPPLLFGAAWGDWIYRGLALLVVGCPCALVISTPVSIVTAIGNAARNGVLIKGGIHLEETGHLSVIAFDKTGTLTKGVPVVTDMVTFEGEDEKSSLGIAAAIEKWSQHPLASAIVRKADDEGLDLTEWETQDFTSITGKGAKAVIQGTTYYIGSPRLFDELSKMNERMVKETQRLQKQGKTVMVLGTETKPLALIAVADEVRDSSRDVIQKLHALGIRKTIMLTGDNRATAEAIGKQVGIGEVKAELLPQQKLEAIKQLKETGKVAMIGDGVNDAPALASATVGIAMGGAGTDTALETADIALMADDLTKLPFTIRLSRDTLKIIKQNIAFALIIKLIALVLIVPGWLTLWLAIFADMGATLIVTLNSLRLLRTKKE